MKKGTTNIFHKIHNFYFLLPSGLKTFLFHIFITICEIFHNIIIIKMKYWFDLYTFIV